MSQLASIFNRTEVEHTVEDSRIFCEVEYRFADAFVAEFCYAGDEINPDLWHRAARTMAEYQFQGDTEDYYIMLFRMVKRRLKYLSACEGLF